ncbi:MAG: cell division protein ZapE [Actinobacteria bacterium]|nr:cell division protein ZapE [Actinomycetota bacterium]MBU1609760.1 cell division protein ZapE [Actinomycetota bacterium]MBU2316265.1 cell division protein ZapE [Actinomycetota bacterium]MBU2385741.1 cell division protein ZapE [Actinomycetota bacterium]
MNAENTTASTTRLVDRHPGMTASELVEHLAPPRQFAAASFDNYIPDDRYPSQAAAVETMRAFAQGGGSTRGGGLFRRRAAEPAERPGVYLDGGFGVGKTHLLAALWHATTGRTFFGTFIEYTAIVGALGYREAVAHFRGAALIAIDEFELDDPGDTMVMSRLLGELVASGTRIAATSNTPPHALGEGRFAAQDFLREIHALADRFTTVRIDGEDYRKRDIEGHAVTLDDDALRSRVDAHGGTVTVDPFADILRHLSTVHPSRYIGLIRDVDAVAMTEVAELRSQTDALRLVAFVDRLYDAQIPIFATGVPLDQVFPDDMLAGGYRKKYLRATSRMIALTSA